MTNPMLAPRPNPGVDPGRDLPTPKPHEIPVERRPDEEPPGVTEPATVPPDPPQELPGGEPVSPVRMGQAVAVAVMAVIAMTVQPLADDQAGQTGVQAQIAPTPPRQGLTPDGELPPAPPEGGIEGGVDRNNPATGGASGETLTERLNRTDGVLKPPPVGDSDIRLKPPEGGTLRVIPPPTLQPAPAPQQ